MKYNNGYLYVPTDNGTVRVKAEAVSEERANIATTVSLRDVFARHAIECTEWEQMEHLARLAEGCGLTTERALFKKDIFSGVGVYFCISDIYYGNYSKVCSSETIIPYHAFISTYYPEIGIASHTITPNEQDWQVRWRKIEMDKRYKNILVNANGDILPYGEIGGKTLLSLGVTHYIPQSLLLNLPTE